MSNWKVSKVKIKLFPHNNADKLEIVRVGTYQCVVQKGLYKDGDTVIFAPEKSVLTGKLREEWDKWLAGPNRDRVKSVVMRGEYSCGIIIPEDLINDIIDLSKIVEGDDISSQLGITKYIPVVPKELEGIESPIQDDAIYNMHDCEQYSIYENEFVDGERIILTEKLHGSSSTYYYNLTKGDKFISTKNQLDKGLKIISETNVYWKAGEHIKIWDIIKEEFDAPWNSPVNLDGSDIIVQVFGEIIPIATHIGFNYGQDELTLKIFDVILNSNSIPYDKLGDVFKNVWVPIIYDGPLDKKTVRKFAEGKECVSGKSIHIKEGVVIRPYIDRKAEDGIKLKLKILNPLYKESGNEIN